MGSMLKSGAGNLVLIGGPARGQTSQPLAIAEFYDATLNAWKSLPCMNQPRCLNAAVVQLRDARIAVFGSDGRSGRDTYELYAPLSFPAPRGK